jgi:hypothetical protein
MQLWLRPQRRASRVGFDGSNQEQGNGWEAEGAGSPAGCGLAWLDSVRIPRVQAWWREMGTREEWRSFYSFDDGHDLFRSGCVNKEWSRARPSGESVL